MSLDNEIKEALRRHESDAQPRSGAWNDVERRIGRSHRRRMVAAGLGAAIAIAAAAVFVPRVGSPTRPQPPIAPGPVSTAGWIQFESKLDGFRLRHPATWTAKRDDQRDLTSLYPNDILRSSGKALFEASIVLYPGDYKDALIYSRKAPDFVVSRGTLPGGYPFVRVEHRIPKENVSVRYEIDWTTPLCRAGTSCPRPAEGSVLDVTLAAATPATWERYGATSEQIVQTIGAIPREEPRTTPSVVAKVPVRAFDLAVGADAIWALQTSPVPGHAGKLIRIDPNTNRQVASIDVGTWPTAVTANADGVWVANGVQAGYAASFPATNSVMRIDPSTNRVVASIRVDKPQDVALGSRGTILWVTTGDASAGITLMTIDPQENKVYGQGMKLPGTAEFARIEVAEGPATDRRDVVWITTAPPSNAADRTYLNRIDSDGHLRTFDIAGDHGHRPLTAGFGSVWVAADHSLVRFDPVTERVVATVEVPDAAPTPFGSLTTGEGYVWVVSGRGELSRVDPTTNRTVGDPFEIGDIPPVGAGEITYGFSSLWIPSGDGKIWRLEP